MAKKATKKAKAPEKSAYEIASELLEVRSEMNVLKQAEKGLADELRKRMKSGEQQDIFYFMPVTSLKVLNGEKAMAWAQKYAPKAITINTTTARKIFIQDALTGSMGTPESNGFALTTTEQLREVKAKGDEPEAGYDIG